MIEIRASIIENPYYWSPEGATVLTRNFDRLLLPKDFSYIKLLLGYPLPNYQDADLFQYLDSESLNNLRSNNTVLLYDVTFEGFSHIEVPIADALYRSCLKYNINPKKIFLFTGNIIHVPSEINVIPIFLLSNSSNWQENLISSVHTARDLCEKNYEKPILSLSRRNRSHRVLAHCMLFNSHLFRDSIISQDILDRPLALNDVERMGLTIEQVNNFINALPLIADQNQFEINDPFNELTELHSKTIFSIVNETLANNLDNTTLFFSEKFLKPIINFQPMLIYGHQGINKSLPTLGFKTYESYFDLSFDTEPDDIIRYKKLLNSASDTIRLLKSMNKEEQISWRFQHLDLLEHNYKAFLENSHCKAALKKFATLLKKIR